MKHRILATFNINKKNQFERLYVYDARLYKMMIKQQLREKKIPKGGNHNPYIKEEQTKYKRTNNDKQNIHIKLKIE